MDIYMDIDLQDCPACGGPANMEEENGWCVYVCCADCGVHTAAFEYDSPTQREEAAQKVANLWNNGKITGGNPNE